MHFWQLVSSNICWTQSLKGFHISDISIWSTLLKSLIHLPTFCTMVTIAWDLNDLKCRNTRCHRCHGVLDCIEGDVAGSRRLGSWKLTPCKLPQNKIFYEEIFYLALWNPHNVSSVLPTFRFMGFESPSPITSTFAPLNVYVTSFMVYL